MDILKATIAKMAAPDESVGDYQQSLLEQAITGVYKKYGNQGTVTAVAEWLLSQPDPDAQRLGKQLYPFAGGQYTRWFDGENNLDMDNAFVVLELGGLKGRRALQQVVLLQLISRINHDIYRTRGRKKVLVIDEGWELLDDPMMEKAVDAAYRKAGKHGASVIIITHSIADLCNSPNSRAIAANSAWQVIPQQKAESIDAAIKGGHFKIDSFGAHLLKGVHTLKGKYSEVMIKQSDTDWGIVRLVVNRFTQVMFSTSGAERDDILHALDRGEDVVEAVNRFIAAERELLGSTFETSGAP
jgi:conjugal transfer ATP-binding protein TraC